MRRRSSFSSFYFQLTNIYVEEGRSCGVREKYRGERSRVREQEVGLEEDGWRFYFSPLLMVWTVSWLGSVYIAPGDGSLLVDDKSKRSCQSLSKDGRRRRRGEKMLCCGGGNLCSQTGNMAMGLGNCCEDGKKALNNYEIWRRDKEILFECCW
jgi:hypothetical protein